MLPSFYNTMTFKEKVHQLLQAGLDEKPDLFLIELSINDANKIVVTLDGDQGVQLQDCIDISRAIEHNLDREEQDFAIEVASVGVGSPLKLVRQYVKNIGRSLEIELLDEEAKGITGKLIGVEDEAILIEEKVRPRKGVKVVTESNPPIRLLLSDIKTATVVVEF